MPSAPVTRASLMLRVNQRANTSGYVDQTTELPQLIDTSLAKLHNILAGELFEDYYQKRFYIQLVSNQGHYQLPNDFMKLRAVFYLNPQAGQTVANSTRYPLRRIDPAEELGTNLNTNSPNIPYGYSMEGNALVLSPAPSQPSIADRILIYYVPEYVPALNDNTPIEVAVAFGWDEWVVNDVVIQIRNKAMMPATELVQERELFIVNLRMQAKQRNLVDPPSVRSTGWRYGNGAPGWGSFSFRN